MDNDIKYDNKITETLINIASQDKSSDLNTNKEKVYTLLSNTIKTTDKFQIQIGTEFREKWIFQELISARIVEILDNFVFCECMVSKLNNKFELRKFDKSLFENLNEIKQNNYVKIQLSKKPGSQRIDVIDGSGLGIEKDFIIKEDTWDIIKKDLKIKEPELR